MSLLQEHIKDYGIRLKSKFESMRKLIKDSDVKGSGNEKMVSEFLAPYVPHNFISNGVSVLDSYSNQSGEMDIVFSNQYQILGKDSPILIAEGVDFSVQVKAIYSSQECERFHKNCASLKNVKKNPVHASTVYNPGGLEREMINYIPYIVLAFEANTSVGTIQKNLIKSSSKYPFIKQPDALFIVDSGLTFLNLHGGHAQGYKSNGVPIKSWLALETGESTLVELIKYINSRVPRIVYPQSPASQYFSKDLPYEAHLSSGT